MLNLVPPGRTSRLASLNARVVPSTRSTPATASTASFSDVGSPRPSAAPTSRSPLAGPVARCRLAGAQHRDHRALLAVEDVRPETGRLDALDDGGRRSGA